jgi:hypothetical protein
MMRVGVLWERTTPEHLTSETEFGSWRTPTVGMLNADRAKDPEYGQRKLAKGQTITLADQVKDSRMWPTPQAHKTTESGEIVNADGTPWNGLSKPHSKNTGRPITTALADAVKMWPTPKAHEPGMTAKTTGRGVEKSTHLTTQVALAQGMIDRNTGRLFPTPTAGDSKSACNATANRKAGSTHHSGMTLCDHVKMWPTPAAQDCKGANSREHCETNGTGRKHMDQLANAVMYPDLLGSRANAVMTGGATSTECTLENVTALKSMNGTLIPTQFATPQSRDFRTGQQSRWENPERTRNLNDQIGGQLNPTWVEWLMGWPLGWTDCAASAMAKFQPWCHSHGISCPPNPLRTEN